MQVAKENGTTLPEAALFIIRFHSFYRKYSIKSFLGLNCGISDFFGRISNFNICFFAALHRAGAYTHLMNREDEENLKWLKIFK